MNKQVKNKKPTKIIESIKKELKPTVIMFGDETVVSEYKKLFEENGIVILSRKSFLTSVKIITLAFELTVAQSDVKKKNLQELDKTLPSGIPIISNSITTTVIEQAQWIQHQERLIGIAAFPTLLSNNIVELTPSVFTTKEITDKTKLFFDGIKKEPVVVQDTIGMVMPRILCQVINEAFFVVQNDIATPKDIDEAMKLGANYPHGPIAWGEMIGFSNVVTVLDALFNHHHEECYRVAPILRQMAIAGIFWKTKE